MRRRQYVWDMMLGNLGEGLGELRSIRDDIVEVLGGKQPWRGESIASESGLKVRFEHAYHHINWSWNCRMFDHERVVKCAMRDFYAWEKFPKEFADLWLPPYRCVTRPRECQNGRICPNTLVQTLKEAFETGENLWLSTMKFLGPSKCGCLRYPTKRLKGIAPIDEEGYRVGVHELIAQTNLAWNTRKLTGRQIANSSDRARRFWKCYPRQFVEYWPSAHSGWRKSKEK